MSATRVTDSHGPASTISALTMRICRQADAGTIYAGIQYAPKPQATQLCTISTLAHNAKTHEPTYMPGSSSRVARPHTVYRLIASHTYETHYARIKVPPPHMPAYNINPHARPHISKRAQHRHILYRIQSQNVHMLPV